MAWAAWVNRIEPHFGTTWKELDIFDAIKLSTIEIIMDQELLMAALIFWCTTTNNMILPLGPIGVTVLDVWAILSTSLSGLPIDTVLSKYQFDLDLKMVFEERAYEVLKKKRLRSVKG